MPVETDKKGPDLEPPAGVDDVDVSADDPVPRRRRRGIRVPSDDVPRPQTAPITAASAADDEFDVDFDDGASPPAIVAAPAAPAELDGVPLPLPRESSGEIIVDESEPDVDMGEVSDPSQPESPPLGGRATEPIPVQELPDHQGEVPPVAPAPVPPGVVAAAETAPPVSVTDQGERAPPDAEEVVEAEELSSAELEEDGEKAPRPSPPPPPAPRHTPVVGPSSVSQPATAVAPSSAAPEPPPRKRKSKAWFEEVFDEDYLRTLPFLTSQVTQREASHLVEALGLRAGQQVLDVGCGYGRHAMELAARGIAVTALDLSLPLLLRGADEAQRRGLNINFVHADMRDMGYEAQFDGAYCLFSTFGYFDDDTNKRVAAAIGRSLKPGARLVLDLLNRDYIVADLPTRVWWEGDGCVVLEEVDFNFFNSRIASNRSIVFEDGRQVEHEISVRAYSLHEVGKLLHGAGFRVLSVSGGLSARGRFFGKDSRQILVVAERRGNVESGLRDTLPASPDPSGNGRST